MPLPTQITVHKFGGSSLTCADSYRQVAEKVTDSSALIVLSAVQEITSTLQLLLEKAKGQEALDSILSHIKFQHMTIATELLPEALANIFFQQLEADLAAIASLLESARLLRSYSRSMQDKVMGFGEIWSARLLSAYLSIEKKTGFIDASQIIVTDKKHGLLTIDWQASEKHLLELFENSQTETCWVATGFLAQDKAGQQVTLGRNGSDFSAAIFANLLNANQLVIWKDVDGILSADPRRVPAAFPIPALSYQSAMELAYFGGTVIHPKTISPVMQKNIPIHIKNFFNPAAEGTVISQDDSIDLPVQGISSIEEVALITLAGAGLIGVSGTAVRVFQVLEKLNISVILISQASSEHSICFAVALESADQAVSALEEAFAYEILQNQIDCIEVDKEAAILAIVGDGMVHRVGIAAKLTSTLANANISIRAIAQGASERNISLVISRSEMSRALRVTHSGFYLSNKSISIGLIGPGLVGGTLLSQIQAELSRLSQQFGITLRVRAICNSKKMLLSDKHLDLSTWQTKLAESTVDTDLGEFVDYILSDDAPHGVVIDCTANAKIAKQYECFMEKGLHVITPNKRANSSDYPAYEALLQTAKKFNRFYFYETTVCAGLPVLSTLEDLMQTGDAVIKIEGVVSGTLSYLFNELAKGKSFSSVIKAAKEGGYTEPDPRDDLSGMDVARKILILARMLGFKSNLSDIDIPVLLPKTLLDCDVETFMQSLPEYDKEINEIIFKNVHSGEKPAYVASVDASGKISVGIQSISNDSPLSRLDGTDNMLIFTTKRYESLPLVIQGPGAGAQVTAAGIFADLLRLMSRLTH